MTVLANISYLEDLDLPRQRETIPLLSLLTVPFIIAVVAVSPLDYWNYIVKALGVLLAIAFFVRSLSANVRASTEIMLYMTWIFWALTGVAVAVYPAVYWGTFLTVVQILIMIFIIAGATYQRKTLTVNLLAFLAGASIVGIYSLVTGEYALPEEVVGGRVSGIALNSNSFGFLMVCGSMVLVYLWMLPHRHPWLWYGPLLAAMICASLADVLSGSRSSIASMVVLYLFWFWFCYRSEVFRRIIVLAAVMLACLVGIILFLYFFLGSVAAERFESAISVFQGTVSTESSLPKRLGFYQEGLFMLLHSPVVGVGLAQFIAHSSAQLVSHSEYTEVFADTGIVGGVLYFSIFVVLWIRAGKIARYTDDLTQFRIARLVRTILIVIMVSNLGRWNYYDKMTWIIFASFIGYTNAVWKELSERLRTAQADEQRAWEA